jgi:hypothetical protein
VHENVEGEIDDVRFFCLPVLHQGETWASVGVERRYLAIDNGARGKKLKRFHDIREVAVQLIATART